MTAQNRNDKHMQKQMTKNEKNAKHGKINIFDFPMFAGPRFSELEPNTKFGGQIFRETSVSAELAFC